MRPESRGVPRSMRQKRAPCIWRNEERARYAEADPRRFLGLAGSWGALMGSAKSAPRSCANQGWRLPAHRFRIRAGGAA
jgi:hypothetical protein